MNIIPHKYVLKLLLVCFVIVQIPLSAQNNSKLTNDNFTKTLNASEDSLKNTLLKECIKRTYRVKDWKLFHRCRFAHLTLTKRIGDSSAYAKTLEYSGSYFRNRFKYDLSLIHI